MSQALHSETEYRTTVPSIEARNLAVCYGDAPVFKDLSFCLPAQGLTAILGPSGCGKSTLLSVMNRLIDTVPGAAVSGELLIAGRNVLSPGTDVHDLRRRVGLIMQRPCPFPVSVARNIRIPLREIGIRNRRRQDEIIEQCLVAAGLWEQVRDRLDQPALQLSGGQQQRLCLARALAVEPDVLLLDEPSSSLDPMAREQVEATILKLAREHPTILVTHDLQQARRLADHALILWPCGDGTAGVAEAGPIEVTLESCCEPAVQAYIRQGLGVYRCPTCDC